MSDSSFDTVEVILKSLKDIVGRTHSQPGEPERLVEDMEHLVAEMKAKTPVEPQTTKNFRQ